MVLREPDDREFRKMEPDHKKQIRIRAGHRLHIKKLVASAEELTKVEDPDINYVECMKITLSEQMSTLQGLDDAILQLVKEENIEKEIDEAGEFRELIQISVVKINTLIKKLQVTTLPTQNNSVVTNGAPVDIIQSQQETTSASTKSTEARTKLPKLTLHKFHGDPKVWNEWWDSYKCAVHENTHFRSGKVQLFTKSSSRYGGFINRRFTVDSRELFGCPQIKGTVCSRTNDYQRSYGRLTQIKGHNVNFGSKQNQRGL